MFIFDGHCDTITSSMNKNENLKENNCQLDLKRLSQFSSPVQFFAICLHPKKTSNPLNDILNAINYFYKETNMKQNKTSGILTLEGAEVLEEGLEILDTLYKMGIRSIGLTWNYKNALGYGAMEKEKKGLTDYGKAVIKEMNNLGILVDVSHLSYTGFWDVEKIVSKPFIASHSNVKNICNHPRNLSDSQIKAIANSGGVVGINSYPLFLNESGKATIEDFLLHIDYVVNLVGIDYVGLGCDFDGIDFYTEGLEDVSAIKKLNSYLEKEYGETGAKKILGLNFLRVAKEILNK
jgi:membrane dipeptidase